MTNTSLNNLNKKQILGIFYLEVSLVQRYLMYKYAAKPSFLY